MDLFDEEIRNELCREEPIPKIVEEKIVAAFRTLPQQDKPVKREKHLASKIFLPFAACLAAICCISFTNPAFAAKIPFVSNVFDLFKNDTRFNQRNPYVEGNPAKGAVTVNQSAVQTNGLEVNVQQISCDGANLYVTYTAKDHGSSLQNNSYLMVMPQDVTVTLDGNELNSTEVLTLKPTENYTFAAMQNFDLTEESMRQDFTIPKTFHIKIQIRKFQLLIPVTADGTSRKRGQAIPGDWNFSFDVTQTQENCKIIPVNQTNNGVVLQKMIQTPSTTSIIIQTPKAMDDPAIVVKDYSGKSLDCIDGYSKKIGTNVLSYMRYSVTPEESKSLTVTVINKNVDDAAFASFTVDLSKSITIG